MRRSVVWRLVVSAAVGAATVPVLLVAADPVLAVPAVDMAAERAAAVNPGMLAAMQRDFGMSRAEVIDRRAREEVARPIAARLRRDLPASFAGAWLSADGRRVEVAVSDWSRAPRVRAAGATPVPARYSRTELDAVVDGFGGLPPGADLMYVDVRANQIVIEVRPGAESSTMDFLRQRDVDRSAVRLAPSAGPVRTTASVYGGHGYTTNLPGGVQERCSAGFGVQNLLTGGLGFVTAGHCGPFGATIRTANSERGVVAGSMFPGTDHGWVQLNNPLAASPFVTDYAGGLIGVIGSRDSVLATEMVCRSGRSSQWRCGNVDAPNVTAMASDANGVPLGTVTGLVGTTACANGGDSGGPFLVGRFALGVLSANNDRTCGQSGARSFYQPIAAALANYGGLRLLTLLPSDAVPPPDPFQISRFLCTTRSAGYPVPTSYVQCTVDWINSADPASADWVVTPDPFGPVSVSTNAAARTSTLRFPCPGPDLDAQVEFVISVLVVDQLGRVDGTSGFAQCPLGPW